MLQLGPAGSGRDPAQSGELGIRPSRVTKSRPNRVISDSAGEAGSRVEKNLALPGLENLGPVRVWSLGQPSLVVIRPSRVW